MTFELRYHRVGGGVICLQDLTWPQLLLRLTSLHREDGRAYGIEFRPELSPDADKTLPWCPWRLELL